MKALGLYENLKLDIYILYLLNYTDFSIQLDIALKFWFTLIANLEKAKISQDKLS